MKTLTITCSRCRAQHSKRIYHKSDVRIPPGWAELSITDDFIFCPDCSQSFVIALENWLEEVE